MRAQSQEAPDVRAVVPLRAEPWFREMEDKQSKSIEGGKGISIVGFAVDVDCSKLSTAQNTKS